MDHNLMEVLLPVSILGTLSIGLVLFTRTLTDYFLRKKMVEKGLVGDDATELLRTQEESKLSSLKWGLIIFSGGVGLMLLEVIPYEYNSPLPFGILATCLSLGFLSYFLIARTLTKE